jgi:hypothetical protein
VVGWAGLESGKNSRVRSFLRRHGPDLESSAATFVDTPSEEMHHVRNELGQVLTALLLGVQVPKAHDHADRRCRRWLPSGSARADDETTVPWEDVTHSAEPSVVQGRLCNFIYARLFDVAAGAPNEHGACARPLGATFVITMNDHF